MCARESLPPPDESLGKGKGGGGAEVVIVQDQLPAWCYVMLCKECYRMCVTHVFQCGAVWCYAPDHRGLPARIPLARHTAPSSPGGCARVVLRNVLLCYLGSEIELRFVCYGHLTTQHYITHRTGTHTYITASHSIPSRQYMALSDVRFGCRETTSANSTELLCDAEVAGMLWSVVCMVFGW